MKKTKNLRATALALVVLTGLAGCNGGDDDSGTPPGTPVPTRTGAPATATVAPSNTATSTATATTVATATPTASPTNTPPVVAGLSAGYVAQGPDGIDDPLWDAAAPLSPTLTNISTGLVYGNGQLNMSGTYNGLTDFNGGAPADLQLRAVHDGAKLYILAEWNDVTFNIDRRRALFDGPTDPLKPTESADGWTSQLNDDKIAFAFEIDTASSEFGPFATAGCASACHNVSGEGLDMRPAEGKVDIWHWKTSRSEPVGHVADQVTNPVDGRKDDAGTGTEVRNLPTGGNNRSGPAFEWDGSPQTFTRWDGAEVTLDVAYVLLDGHKTAFAGDAVAGDGLYTAKCAGCHGAAGQGGFGPALDTVEIARLSRAELDMASADAGHPGASSYNGLTEQEMSDVLARVRGFAGVPGYYVRQPSGSVADVVTKTNVDFTEVNDTTWVSYRVLIIRDLDTGNADDKAFAPGQGYPFGVALMDNDGRNHIGSALQTLTLQSVP